MSSAAPATAADPKLIATVKAEAALAGLELIEMDDGTFWISKWNLSRSVPDLRAARELISRISGRLV